MKLATVLKALGDAHARIDDQAGKVLDIVRTNSITTEHAFRTQVAEAYEELGWRTTPGRPATEDGLHPAPKSVRQYVFEIRRAFKLRIKVAECRSLHEMRALVKEKRERLHAHATGELHGAVAGLRVVQPDRFTGAYVHDLAVLYENLNKREKAELEDGIKRLLHKFAPKASQQLRLVA